MFDWEKKMNGNFVAIEDGQVTTVFRNHDGNWQGIRDGEITACEFDTPDEAMDAIDNWNVKFVPMRKRPDETSWRESKKGGMYRWSYGRLAVIKQAKSAKWYITIDGSVKDHWLDTELEAIGVADRLLR